MELINQQTSLGTSPEVALTRPRTTRWPVFCSWAIFSGAHHETIYLGILELLHQRFSQVKQ